MLSAVGLYGSASLELSTQHGRCVELVAVVGSIKVEAVAGSSFATGGRTGCPRTVVDDQDAFSSTVWAGLRFLCRL